MRRREQLDPVAARELAAIDAALAGNPQGAIAPEDAELAELATLLVAEAPRPSASFAASLDARVARRFPAPAKPREARRTRRLPLVPAFAGVALAAVLALLVAFNAIDSGGDAPTSSGGSMALDSGASAGAGESAASEAPAAAPESAPDADAAAGGGAGATSNAAPSPAIGRKVEQSSTVELGAPAEKVDDVAQGVLGVVDRNGGIVDESTVATRTGGGEASFELRIPAARLQAALGQLSRLPDAEVLSRTDDTLDVNQAYVSVRRKLDAAEAERTGLLRALENASDDAERDRLKVRIGEVEQQVATLARSQRALDRRVDYSRVDLTVRAVADDGSGGGTSFTPGSALHDAGRVLAVTAGVIVIAAAALVPVVLLALLAWPLVRAARRRRREHALDHA